MRFLKLGFFLTLYILVALFIVTSLNKKKDIKVGFVSSFSRNNSEAGIQGRNAILMAIDEINNRGGIDGRELTLITVNTNNTYDGAREATKGILENNPDVILGPTISSMAAPVIETTKGKNILVISPSVKSDEFSGIDDHFIRVNTSTTYEGNTIAKAVIFRGNRRVALLWSRDNSNYTTSVISGVRNSLADKNIEVVYEQIMQNGENLSELILKLKEMEVDGIVIAASGVVTGDIAQRVNILGFHPDLYGCEWALATNLIEIGATTVDGMIIFNQVGSYSSNPNFRLFSDKFKRMFYSEPASTAILSYDAMMVFYQAMVESGGRINRVKDIIVSGKIFSGLIEDFYFDKYGDAIRNEHTLFIINNSTTKPFYTE